MLPRTEPVDWSRRGGAGNRHTPAHGLLADAFAASEIDGLRPYRPGTPASRIHWAALARGAGLLERRMRAEQESRPLIVLDSRCTEEALPSASTWPCERPPRSCSTSPGAAAAGCSPPTADERWRSTAGWPGWPAARTRLALIAPSRRALRAGRPPPPRADLLRRRRAGRPPSADPDGDRRAARAARRARRARGVRGRLHRRVAASATSCVARGGRGLGARRPGAVVRG